MVSIKDPRLEMAKTAARAAMLCFDECQNFLATILKAEMDKISRQVSKVESDTEQAQGR